MVCAINCTSAPLLAWFVLRTQYLVRRTFSETFHCLPSSFLSPLRGFDTEIAHCDAICTLSTGLFPAIDRIVQAVEASLKNAEYIFIDEIGKMELLSTRFKRFVDDVFTRNKPVIATVHRHLVARYRNEGQVFLLTRDNFEQIRNAIQAELNTSEK